MPLGVGRVDQRADDGVEDSLDPQGHFGREHLVHHRVEIWGVQEADANHLDQLFHLLRAEVDCHPQFLQHVGAAGSRRERPAAMLGNRYPPMD